jgi:putative flavoprotein involved in K+ transport
MRRIEAVVIGGGHAGLSTSYYLNRAGIEHVVLEKGRVAQKWRDCWDSFHLNTANWAYNLPGFVYSGTEPDVFPSRDEAVQHLEAYARSFQAPVETSTRVTSVTRQDNTFIVKSEGGDYEARAVVVASGYFARPRIPASAADLAPDIFQIHTSAYKNPSGLPPGGVLVVGSAQSGPQIAEDLFEAGRDVYLSTSRTGRTPRRYRGEDGFWWMLRAGLYSVPVEQQPEARFAPARLLSGTRGGHTINLHQLAGMGITLLGHYEGGNGHRLSFAPNLHWNLAESDALTEKVTRQIDAYIEKENLEVPARSPDNTEDYDGDDGFRLPEVTELDVRSAGVRSVVWATGFHPDYSYVRLPVFDETGYPVQRRGITAVPGLYFMGVHFQHTGTSDLFVGVGEDAAFVAAALEHRLHDRPVASYPHKRS